MTTVLLWSCGTFTGLKALAGQAWVEKGVRVYGCILCRTLLSPSGCQCPQWAVPLSPQVLAALLTLTAVAELALAFVDAEQEAVPAVQYTNPSLYIATWVRAQL